MSILQHATEVLRQTVYFSYGSTLLPYAEDVEFQPTSARRVGKLPQWTVERDNFEKSVKSGYDSLPLNSPRLLVAGTGVGKTTKLPMTIASFGDEVGIVVCPENPLAYLTHAYVNGNMSGSYPGVTTAVLRSSHATTPLRTPAVYYTSGADLLAHIASKPKFIQSLGTTFIYLDESHTIRPDYHMFMRLCGTPHIPPVKIFYGTATAAADVSLEGGGVGRSIVVKPDNYFPVRNPYGTASVSPMHYDKIVNRTMIFLPTDSDVDAWDKYYSAHDVPVLKLKYSSSSTELVDVVLKIKSYSCCVLLTTSRLQTGYTIDVDTVIDTGFTQVFKFSPDCSSTSLQVVPETAIERVQRAGRVGRHKPGVVYQSDMPNISEPAKYEDPEVAFYEYLWTVVFSMRVNDPAISKFVELTGELTPKAAAMLLQMRIPALCALPYVGNRGYYRGFDRGMKMISFSGRDMFSDEDIIEKTVDWPELSTGPQPWLSAPDVYSCMVAFPKEWAILPYIVWKFFQDQDFVKSFNLSLDSRSVITAVQDPRPNFSRKPSHGLTRPREQPVPKSRDTIGDYTQMRDALRSRMSVSPAAMEDLDYVLRPRSTTPSLPRVPSPLPLYNPTVPVGAPVVSATPLRSRLPSDDNKARVENWRAQAPLPAPPESPTSNKSSSSTRSIVLAQVDPMKYKNSKLFPCDKEMYYRYRNHEEHFTAHSISRDTKHVTNLLTGKANFGSMSSERKEEYFLSILRIHNLRAVARLQGQALVGSGRKQTISMNIRNVTIESSEELIDATVRLLKAAEFESYYVSVDERSLHASIVSVQDSPLYDEQQAKAYVALAFGDPLVKHKVGVLKSHVFAALLDYVHKGNYIWTGTNIFMPDHLYGLNCDNLPQNVKVELGYDTELVALSTVETRDDVVCRMPNAGERVVVLANDPVTAEVGVFGDFVISGSNDLWVIDHVFTFGYSGAAVVSLVDAAIVGIYSGWHADYGDVNYGRVVPLFNHAQL